MERKYARNNWGNVHFLSELTEWYIDQCEQEAQWEEEWAQEEALEAARKAAGITEEPEEPKESSASDDDDDYDWMEEELENSDPWLDYTWQFGVGDEIWTDSNGYAQYGVILAIIRDFKGRPACYKVWRSNDDEDWENGCFDYIEAHHVHFYENYGSIENSLARIGYKYVPFGDPDDCVGYYKNETTGDVADTW